MIEIRDLVFSYGRRVVLDGITTSFGEGVTGVVGANGAGKTTLLRLIAGLLRPQSGEIGFLRGSGEEAVAPAEIHPREIGYLPQGARPTPLLTVRAYVEYVAHLRGEPRAEIADHVSAALERVDLLAREGERTSKLSGGLFRRLVLAAALVSDPPVLLLDEPTSALDPVRRVELRNLIRETKSDRTVVLATHLLEDVAQVADRVIVLSGNHIVFAGTPEEMAAVGGNQVEQAVGHSLEAAMIAMTEEEEPAP
jgi:ABC-2 type transport system ATP-binding protein